MWGSGFDWFWFWFSSGRRYQKVSEHPCYYQRTLQQFLPWGSQITQNPAASQRSPGLVKPLSQYESIPPHTCTLQSCIWHIYETLFAANIPTTFITATLCKSFQSIVVVEFLHHKPIGFCHSSLNSSVKMSFVGDNRATHNCTQDYIKCVMSAVQKF